MANNSIKNETKVRHCKHGHCVKDDFGIEYEVSTGRVAGQSRFGDEFVIVEWDVVDVFPTTVEHADDLIEIS